MKTTKIKLKMFFFKLHLVFLRLFFRTKVRYSSRETKCAVKKSKTAFIIAYNHVGFYDATLLLSVFLKRYLRLVATEEIARTRFTKFFFSWNGVILINRGGLKLSDYSTITRSIKAGFWVGIAPEGHINRGEKIDELSPGAAQFSLSTKTPLLPIYIVPRRKLFWRRQLIYIGDPISPEGDKTTLTEKLKSRLVTLQSDHNAQAAKKKTKLTSLMPAEINPDTDFEGCAGHSPDSDA